MNYNHPYLNDDVCYERLFSEYKMYNRRLIIAFNFDNTIYDIHKKGYDFSEIIDLLRECKSRGMYLICISDEHSEQLASEYLDKKEFPFDSINKNNPYFTPKSGRLYYNLLLDDRAGLLSSFHVLKKIIENTTVGVN